MGAGLLGWRCEKRLSTARLDGRRRSEIGWFKICSFEIPISNLLAAGFPSCEGFAGKDSRRSACEKGFSYEPLRKAKPHQQADALLRLAVLFVASVLCLPAGPVTAAETPASQPVAGQALERTYRTDLSLAVEGRPACTIVHPSQGDEWRKLADRVAAAIEERGGGAAPAIADTQAVPQRLGTLRAELSNRTLIVLGDLASNRAILPFYSRYHTCCDARYPGDGGYELRTVVRPFGGEASSLIVGASTPEAAAAAVDRLCERIAALPRGGDLSLPYLLEVKLGAEMEATLAPVMRELGGPLTPPERGGFDAEFMRQAHLYFYTGDERFAGRARDAFMKTADAGNDTPGFGVSDYTLENLSAAWRRVSGSAAFSKSDLVRLDERMWQTAVTLSKAWWRIPPEKGIGNRHQTTGGLAWYTLVRDLQEIVQPDAAAREQLAVWRREAEAYGDGLLRHYWDDEDDYQSADSIQNAASYALQAGRMDWFSDGLARRAAERLVMTVDNLGWYAGIQGYGDALPGWERFPLDAGMFMGACAFVYEDGSYLDVLERFPTLSDSWGSLQPWGLHQYSTGRPGEGRPPAWMNGLRVARFTPYKLDRVNSGEFFTTSIMDNFRPAGFFARPVDGALAFDKLCYRAGPDADDLYLLLEGSSGTTLTTIDMNAIIRMTDAGKLWLVHNTGRRSLFYKNAVYVGKGTNAQPMAPSSELIAHQDFGRAALAVSRLPDCRGMSVTRNVLISRDAFCVVIDRVRADESGDYSISCNWRTPGWAELRGGAWEAIQDDVTFRILPGSLEGVVSRRPPQRDGATRPTTLRENRSLNAAVGDEVTFENLLYTATAARPRTLEVRQVAPGVMAIREGEEGALYLAAAGDPAIAMSGLRSDASVVLVAPDGIYMAGGKTLEIADEQWTSDVGAIALNGERAAVVRSVLEKLWAEAAPSSARSGRGPETSAVPLPTGPETVWKTVGPATRGALVDGVRFLKGRNITGLSLLATDWIMPLLAAEPRLMGRQQSELIRESRQEQAGAIPDAEPVVSPLAGAEFTLELPGVTKIGDIDIFGDTWGQTADPLPSGVLRAELTFSSDGFVADRRVRQVDLPRRPTFHNLYKGHCYLFECYTARELNERASAVRARIIDGPGEKLTISDVQVRAADEWRRPVPQTRCIDLDGDGKDEILAWTMDGDVAAYRFDGSAAWSHAMPEGILAVDAWDLDGDGSREVFVSRLDRQVNVFNNDGTPRWSKDYRVIRQETGGKFFGDGAAVYGMAVWQPATSVNREAFFTSYWFTTRLDPKGKVKEVFRRSGHAADIRMVPEPLPGAGGLAIRCDVPWPGSVPLQWWDAATGQSSFENAVPNGRCLFFELDDYNRDGQVEAMVAAEQGLGLYAPREAGTIWEHMTDAPPVGVGVIRGSTDEPARICYGREDGYVFMLAADGTLLASRVLDEPLQCLTATSGPRPMVWVGTRTSLLGLRASDLSPVWRTNESFAHLTIQRLGTEERVLAVTGSGGLAVFSNR